MMIIVTNRLEPAGCRVKAATSLIAFKGAVTLISTTTSLSSPTTTLIASTTSLSSPKVFLILFLQTLSDDECMLLRWCSPPQVTVTQARPRVAPPRAQPSSSFPGLCVYTQVRLLHILFFTFDGTGKLPRLVGAYQTYHLLPWVSQCAPRLSGISSISNLFVIIQHCFV